MQKFKRGMALMLVICMVMGFVLTDKPVVANAETFDPYVYVFGPDLNTIPAYYQNYAKAFVGWSPHMLPPDYQTVWLFNLVKVDEVVEDQVSAPEGAYASVSAFCGDLFVDVAFGARYRRIDLEDAHFSTGNDTSNAEHIRAVVENSMPYLDDPATVQAAANEYLTETYGSSAAQVKQLTGSELASAIQAAIWSFSDEDDFVFDNSLYFEKDNPYFGTVDYEAEGYYYTRHFPRIMSMDAPLDIDEKYSDPRTSDNIYGVYRYLRGLEPEVSEDVLITEDSIFLEKAVVIGSGDNRTLNLIVGINGTIDGDDDLVLTAKCGDQTKTFQLGTTTTAEKVAEGLYAITFTGVSEADCAAVELVLNGEQKATGAFYFEAEPTGNKSAKDASQGFVGYSSDSAPVQSKTTVTPLANAVTTEITKVDEKSGNPLSGVFFDLYMKQEGDDLKVGSFSTDENGKITVAVTDDDAEYYFVETEALDGYEVIEDSVTGGRVPNSWSAGSLEISKKLINTTPAQVGETFNFKLTLDLSTAPVTGNGISWMTDAYLMGQLDCSKALNWSVTGQQELTATFTLDADETVTIDSIPLGSTYTVKEVPTEENQGWFTVTTKVDNGNPQNGDTAQGIIDKENVVLFTNTVKTGPELQLGGLEVSKELVNNTPASVRKNFDFKITLDLSTADVYTDAAPWMNDEYLMSFITCGENLAWTKEGGKYIATFTIDAGETVTIDGIAYGASYTVEEIPAEGDDKWFTVTTQVGNEDPVKGNSISGTVEGNKALTFTNTVVTGPELQLGGLEVSKKLINTTPAEVGETFNFKITLDLSTADVYTDAAPWMNDEYLMSFITCGENLAWTKEAGKYTATFTIDAGETVTIDGIAYGTAYTVEEILTVEDREWFESNAQIGDTPVEGSSASGTVADRNALIFTNSVVVGPELVLGGLEVSKKLINTTPAEVGETFNFRITIDLSTADVYVDAAPWMNDEYLLSFITGTEELTWTVEGGKYIAEFTVNADETFTIDGVAYGTSYTVEEILTEEDREWFESNAQIGDTPVEGSSVSGTVAERNALIFTNSVVTGPVLQTGSVEVSKKLINTTPAEVGETFNFKITLDLSTADVYVDAAPWMNDEYLLSFITGTEELTWTVEGGKYIAEFTVNADETFTIDGIAYGTAYTVEEILTEEDREWFESNAQIGDTPVEGSSASGTVAQRNALIFTNSVVTGPVLQTGSVEVSKKLINTTPAEVGETFNFKITLDLSTADVYVDAAPWMNDEYLLSFITGTEELIWTAEDGKYIAEFTVNADETVTIDGIAYGASYTVEEILTVEDREWFTVTTQIGDEEAVDGTAVEGTVAERNALIFTNTVKTGPELQLGDLEVSKKLINATAAQVGEYFNFSIVIDFSTADVCQNPAPWMNNDYLIGQVKCSKELIWTESGNGTYTATFTLKADETITIEGIAVGSGYTVREELTEADRSVYRVTTQINTDGTAAENESYVASGSIAAENAVRFTNEYVQEDIPVTGNFGIEMPLLLCFLTMLTAAILLLNRRRFV